MKLYSEVEGPEGTSGGKIELHARSKKHTYITSFHVDFFKYKEYCSHYVNPVYGQLHRDDVMRSPKHVNIFTRNFCLGLSDT